jgi:hypothetical protein
MGFLPGPGSSGLESSVAFLIGGSGSFVAPACAFGFSSLPIRASSLVACPSSNGFVPSDKVLQEIGGSSP